MATQHVFEVLPQAVASGKTVIMAVASGSACLGDVLLLLGPAQRRDSQEEEPAQSRTGVRKR